MSTYETLYDDPALAGEAVERDARALLGQVIAAVVIAASIFLDVFNVFLLVLDLFGGDRK